MFGIFKRKRIATAPATNPSPPLFFKDGSAAFEFACRFMECKLAEGCYLPSLVLDSRELIGTKNAVTIGKDGNQIALLRAASDDGGFLVIASTMGPAGQTLQSGQLVSWLAGRHSPEIAVSIGSNDKRSGWIGLIVGTLKPAYRAGAWVGGDTFTQ